MASLGCALFNPMNGKALYKSKLHTAQTSEKVLKGAMVGLDRELQTEGTV